MIYPDWAKSLTDPPYHVWLGYITFIFDFQCIPANMLVYKESICVTSSISSESTYQRQLYCFLCVYFLQVLIKKWQKYCLLWLNNETRHTGSAWKMSLEVVFNWNWAERDFLSEADATSRCSDAPHQQEGVALCAFPQAALTGSHISKVPWPETEPRISARWEWKLHLFLCRQFSQRAPSFLFMSWNFPETSLVIYGRLPQACTWNPA